MGPPESNASRLKAGCPQRSHEQGALVQAHCTTKSNSHALLSGNLDTEIVEPSNQPCKIAFGTSHSHALVLARLAGVLSYPCRGNGEIQMGIIAGNIYVVVVASRGFTPLPTRWTDKATRRQCCNRSHESTSLVGSAKLGPRSGLDA